MCLLRLISMDELSLTSMSHLPLELAGTVKFFSFKSLTLIKFQEKTVFELKSSNIIQNDSTGAKQFCS